QYAHETAQSPFGARFSRRVASSRRYSSLAIASRSRIGGDAIAPRAWASPSRSRAGTMTGAGAKRGSSTTNTATTVSTAAQTTDSTALGAGLLHAPIANHTANAAPIT